MKSIVVLCCAIFYSTVHAGEGDVPQQVPRQQSQQPRSTNILGVTATLSMMCWRQQFIAQNPGATPQQIETHLCDKLAVYVRHFVQRAAAQHQ